MEFAAVIKSGFVYVLRNEAMPGLVKVGFTMKSPEDRAAELFSSGVPQPFSVVFAVMCDDPQSVEQRTHLCLSPFRLANNREFFRVNESHAVFCLMSVIAARFEDVNIVKDWMVVKPLSIENFAIALNIDISDASSLISDTLDSIAERHHCDNVKEEMSNAFLSCT